MLECPREVTGFVPRADYLDEKDEVLVEDPSLLSIDMMHRVSLSLVEKYNSLMEATIKLELFNKLCNKVGIIGGLESLFLCPYFVPFRVGHRLSTIVVL